MGYSFAAFSRLYTLHHTPYTLMVYRLWAITCPALRAQVALASYGGTLRHSLEVLLYALKHNKYKIPKDSLIIVCLLHDLCKIHGFRHIHGHSKRSVKLIQDVAHVHLKSDEYYAIKYHMKGYKKVISYCKNYMLVIDSPLWKLIRSADKYSAGHEMSKQELIQQLQNI